MKRITITIIGMGPRGLSILERILAVARSHQLLLDLVVIEPGECGQGVHMARQPQHLLINTLASQVSLFPAPEMMRHAPVCATPTLTEWARQQGYRRVGEEYYRIASTGAGAEIGERDYLPRRLLGEYLVWSWQQLYASLPPGTQLVHHRHRAVDLWRQPDGRCMVELDCGYQVLSDYVFLATGHGSNQMSEQESWYARFAQEHARYNGKLAYLRQLYPMERLGQVSAEARVLIQGMGLTAHDVVAELTIGRGGVFVRDEQGLRYERSGREPQLLLCSRNCLPAAARGINQKGVDGRHQARYFTVEAIAALRERARSTRSSPQLDFEAELLPLLKREMALAYRQSLNAAQAAVAAGARPPQAAHSAQSLAPLLGAVSSAGRRARGEPSQSVAGEGVRPKRRPAMPSEPRPEDLAVIDALLFPLRDTQFASLAECRAFFTAWLRTDLAHAMRGNLGSPVKAATDVLRDVRAALQAAIEHGGLTPASHRKFLNVYNPIINRIAFGPPLRRNEEWLALLDAGVLQLGGGPGATIGIDEQDSTFILQSSFGSRHERQPFDVLLPARLDVFYPETDESPLMRNLLRRGLARPYYNGVFHPGGLDITSEGQLIDKQGLALPNIWAVGYPVEGPHYYTHALPRPLLRSRQVLDADRCVNAMFDHIVTRAQRSTAPAVVL
jgi:uncharacterized NAD(P)/FAD-binding protein YdhS